MVWKSGRGGSRQGAGRKKGNKNQTHLSDDERRLQIMVRLPGKLLKRLKSESRPAGRIIEEALIQYYKGRRG